MKKHTEKKEFINEVDYQAGIFERFAGMAGGALLDFQIDFIRDLMENELSQIKSNGVERIIEDLQTGEGKAMMKEILPSGLAGKFKKQSAAGAARSSCTIISRYGYTLESCLIDKSVMKSNLISYGEHYLKRIADESIVQDGEEGDKDRVFTYVMDSAKLVSPYAKAQYWEIERDKNNMTRNALMMAEMKKQNRKIVLIRENSEADYDGTGHTLFAIRNSVGEYIICDSYHGRKFGETMTERYHTNGVKWLRWIYGEINI